MRPSPKYENGGIIEFEAPIHVSNVAILDPKENVPTRVGYKFIDGKKYVMRRSLEKLLIQSNNVPEGRFIQK